MSSYLVSTMTRKKSTEYIISVSTCRAIRGISIIGVCLFFRSGVWAQNTGGILLDSV